VTDHFKTRFRAARLLAAAAPLAAAVAIAACSSSSPTAPSSNVTFSKCMRADGVPNFPDLSSNGGLRIEASGQTISINGVQVNAPAYVAARQRCQKYLPHGDASPAQSARQTQRGLQFSRCMRSHGVPNFPDPKIISSSGGNHTVFLRGVNPGAPAVQAAAKACGGGPKGP
jgi:hypothetical protein